MPIFCVKMLLTLWLEELLKLTFVKSLTPHKTTAFRCHFIVICQKTLYMHFNCFKAGAAFSKVPRKISGKLLILLLLLLPLLLHSFLLLRWTELIGLLVQCSTVALYPLDDVATCVSVGPTPKIRSFPKIFLVTFENVAPGLPILGVSCSRTWGHCNTAYCSYEWKNVPYWVSVTWRWSCRAEVWRGWCTAPVHCSNSHAHHYFRRLLADR